MEVIDNILSIVMQLETHSWLFLFCSNLCILFTTLEWKIIYFFWLLDSVFEHYWCFSLPPSLPDQIRATSRLLSTAPLRLMQDIFIPERNKSHSGRRFPVRSEVRVALLSLSKLTRIVWDARERRFIRLQSNRYKGVAPDTFNLSTSNSF